MLIMLFLKMFRFTSSIPILLVGTTFVAGCAPPRTTSSKPSAKPYKIDKNPEAILTALAEGKEQKLLIVVQNDPAELGLTSHSMSSPGNLDSDFIQKEIHKIQAELVSSSKKMGISAASPYRRIPVIKATAKSLDDLNALANTPGVVSISQDIRYKHSGASNLKLIRQPEAIKLQKTGAGTSIAVLDTGLDFTHADFGECSEPGIPANTCRVSFVKDFAPSDGLSDDAGRHGTNVSAIIAKVAPGAKLLGLDVFEGDGAWESDIISAIDWTIANQKTYNIAAMNMSFGADIFFETCEEGALPVAIKKARDAGLLSVVAAGNSSNILNLSYPACSPHAVSVGAVHDEDMGVTEWHCSDQSKTDLIACFSNFSERLSLLAPGVMINAGGVIMSGTSQAAPHVAGAIAILKSAFPNENPNTTVERLRGGGRPISHPQLPRQIVPRLDLAASLSQDCVYNFPKEITAIDKSHDIQFSARENCQWNASSQSSWIKVTSAKNGNGSGKITLEFQKPENKSRSGTLKIDVNGAPILVKILQPPDTFAPRGSLTIKSSVGEQFAMSRVVSLSIQAEDINGVKGMCISNSKDCQNFTPYRPSIQWTLSPGDGLKTVYLYLQDSIGNTTPRITAPTASILLDMTQPVDGKFNAETRADDKIIFIFSGVKDTLQPTQYMIVSGSKEFPHSCSEGQRIYQGDDPYFRLGPMTPGVHYFRGCVVDPLGRQSKGLTAISTVEEVDKTPPFGMLESLSNLGYYFISLISLDIKAIDRSGVNKMCLSETPICKNWIPYKEGILPFEISPREGPRTIYLWVEDGVGNRSPTPMTTSFILDTMPPTSSKVVASSSYGAVTLNWSAANDGSGIKGYSIVYKTGKDAPPQECVGGNEITVGKHVRSFRIKDLKKGIYYTFRVCPIDTPGRRNPGTVVTLLNR